MRNGNFHEQESDDKTCIKLYEESQDPWGNKETGIYKRILKPFIEVLDKHLNNVPDPIKVYDLGAGGGNIVDALNYLSSKDLHIDGCDVSQKAVDYLNATYLGSFNTVDLETFLSTEDSKTKEKLSSSDVVTFIDVIYYMNRKRYYKDTVMEIWKALKPGALLFYGDNLRRFQYRQFIKDLPNAELILDLCNYDEPVCQEQASSGRFWYRYFKGVLIKKVI